MNFFICEMRYERYLIYKKLSLCAFLSTIVTLSFFASSNIFQNQFQLVYGQQHQTSLSNNPHYYSENDISNTLMDSLRK